PTPSEDYKVNSSTFTILPVEDAIRDSSISFGMFHKHLMEEFFNPN
ncbi:2086_t:CDS:1, partial [Funneliformis mosseae]